MVSDNLNLCAMECGRELGPDGLEFVHDGFGVSGICGQCLTEMKKFRVIFEKGDDDIFVPIEVVPLESLTETKTKKKK